MSEYDLSLIKDDKSPEIQTRDCFVNYSQTSHLQQSS